MPCLSQAVPTPPRAIHVSFAQAHETLSRVQSSGSQPSGWPPLLVGGACGLSVAASLAAAQRRPERQRCRCSGATRAARRVVPLEGAAGYLGLLHPELAAAVEAALPGLGSGREGELDVLMLGEKEEPGGVQGVKWDRAAGCSQPPTPPTKLREMPADSFDVVVEMRSAELLLHGGSREAWANRFYPLGGHAFSLAQDFIVNLASVAKVLRVGGKFFFICGASSEDEVLPFAFLALPHVDWEVQVLRCTGAVAQHMSVCVATARPGKMALLPQTPHVVAEQCLSEMSRQRYFEALRPWLRRLRASGAASELGSDARGEPLTVLDYGGGDGGLAAWAYTPEVVAADGFYKICLLESNADLAAKAASRLTAPLEAAPTAEALERLLFDKACRALVAVGGVGEWPLASGAVDVILLAFVLHHVPLAARPQLLREARRVARRGVLVLEDQPQVAATEAARRLAWQVTEEHFRPFGQRPEDFADGVLDDEAWRQLFDAAGLRLLDAPQLVPATLRHPVPHLLYALSPS